MSKITETTKDNTRELTYMIGDVVGGLVAEDLLLNFLTPQQCIERAHKEKNF